jgi:CheY-like chemotaxis protein
MLRRLLGEDIELQTQLCPDPATVKGDEGQLEQILTNLLINARDAMPKGGRIGIETSLIQGDNTGRVRSQTSVRLRVMDSGVGMDTQTLPHIFEPFFTTKETAKGTGLGLATVYGIVQQAGGYIEVASRPGKGTTFDLYFPHTMEKPHGDRRKPGARNVRGGTETILLVEDNLIVGNVARRLLQKCGYAVIMARNGEEAVALCKENAERLHLLVTDIVMPGMSGVDLAQEVKKIAPTVPVLFMSGYSDDVLARHHISQEGIAFIEKAHLANNLSYRVRQLLDAPADPNSPEPSRS